MSEGKGDALGNTSASEHTELETIHLDEAEGAELAKLQEENVNLATEVQLLKIQLSKTLQLPEQLHMLNQKNLRLSSELGEANQKVEGLQQRLRHTQQKNADLLAKNKELAGKIQEFETTAEVMNANIKRFGESELQTREVVRQLQDANTEMLRARSTFLNECKSMFGETIESEAQVVAILKGMNMSPQALEKMKERENERSQLKQALKSTGKQLEKVQKRAKEEKKNNLALERAFKELEVRFTQLKEELSESQHKNQQLAKQNEALRESQTLLSEKMQQIQADRNEEIANYKDLIRIRDERIKQMQSNLTNPELDPEITRLVSEVAALKEMNRKLSLEKEELQGNAEKLSAKLTAATVAVQKMKDERVLVRNKFAQMKRVQDEITKSNGKLKKETQALQNSVEEKKQEVRVLQEKVKSLSSQAKETPTEHEHFIDGSEVFEPLLAQQKVEIEVLSRERQKLFEIVNSQTSLMISTERILENNRREIDELRKKLNSATKRTQSSPVKQSFDVHRMVQILRTVFVSQLNEPLRATVDSILARETSDIHDMIRDVAIAISKRVVAERAQLPPELLLAQIRPFDSDKKVYPSSLEPLFEGTYDERVAFIAKLRENGLSSQDAINIITMFVLVSVANEKQNKELQDELDKKAAWISDYSRVFGETPVSALEEQFDKLSEKAGKCKPLKSRLRELRGVEEYCNELQKLSGKQAKQIDSLKNDLRVLVKDVSELQKQLESKTSQLAKVEESYEAVQNELATQRATHLQQITEYENTLSKRNQELMEGKSKLTQTTVDLERQLTEAKSENDSLQKKVIKLEEKVRVATSRLQETERSMNSRIDAKANENQAEIQHLSEIQDELKAKLMQTISVMKEQISDNESLSAELASQKKMCDSANERISKLMKTNKVLDMKVASLLEQMARDKEILTTQFKFQAMSNETKHQQEMTALKSQCSTDLNTIVLTLTEEFEEFADVEPSKCMDVQKAIHRVAHNYRRMRQQIRQ